MTIIDSQVHAYEANTPKRPWHSVPVTGAPRTIGEVTRTMGVPARHDGALS
jgi:hypothetical protein